MTTPNLFLENSASPWLASRENLSVNYLRQFYAQQQELFQAQPEVTRNFIKTQAQQIAEAVLSNRSSFRLALPPRVVTPNNHPTEMLMVPAELRELSMNSFLNRIRRQDARITLQQQLLTLEQSENRAVKIAASLLRHSIAMYMVYSLLPNGLRVNYRTVEGDEIPSVPAEVPLSEPAITASTDAVNEDLMEQPASEELLVPYPEAARRFFLPQWVAFDLDGNLMVSSIDEAKSYLDSMERFVRVLQTAVYIAPYLVADEEYLRKRSGMLGQIVNQGRSLAYYEIRRIIEVIRRRMSSNSLNRGLKVSLPYFDDQKLALKTYEFEIIPVGRIEFVPAFIVRAAREERVKILQDPLLSAGTRKHLLVELTELAEAFYSDPLAYLDGKVTE